MKYIKKYFVLVIVSVLAITSVGNVVQARINNGTGLSGNTISVGTGSGIWSIGPDSSDSNTLKFSPSSTLTPSYFNLTTTGTVGISSTTPWGQFSINGSAGGSIPLLVVASSTSANATNTVAFVNSAGDFFVGQNGSGFAVNQSAMAARGIVEVRQNANTSSGGVTITNSGITNTLRLWSDGSVARIDSNSGGTGQLTLNVGGGAVGISTSTPVANFQVTNASANATTTSEFGKANQNKGSCLKLYRTDGSAIYAYVAAGATAFTLSTTACASVSGF